MSRRRGITILEILIALAVIAALVIWFCVATFANRRTAARLKDADQIHQVMQAMIVWSNNSVGEYPLPSRMDTGDTTVREPGRAKNTTANIFSIMIYNGCISPQHLVSVRETNPSIVAHGAFAYNAPATAVNPQDALWDPSFSADFTSGMTGNMSFAHLQPAGRRMAAWSDTFSPEEAVLANRGPEITAVTVKGNADDAGSYSVMTRAPRSLASEIHGTPSRWQGNVASNDGRVDFVKTLGPLAPWGNMSPRRTTLEGKAGDCRDVLFFDEPEDSGDFNLFLGIFTKAGETASEFKGIWD